ncbi:Fe2+-dependent dioxygenase [Prochlorococcus sp. MIT 1341]|uniref:Fe2+-dependent dioxygenase n=1 Tax=Prochlorococcus sp. MIT 1341 TaxID=3096221 RepID=UPI002A74FFAB|nr:Fe2+-dependent dioxygenase [Prochlorococcus sp. MIT 1341]
MEVLTHHLFNADEINKMLINIAEEESSWVDGKSTAGSHAAISKNNRQLLRESRTSQEQSEIVLKKMYSDMLIKSFSIPKHIHGLMFTRATLNQGYGTHLDNAFMSSGRSDLSFTIFLNSPNDYEGGELCIQTIQNSEKIKLEPGHIVIYPSTQLHSVEQVTSGERFACVGWIESYVSCNEDRNLLFGLDAGARGLLSTHGRSAELDLVFQAYTNLLRRFGG